MTIDNDNMPRHYAQKAFIIHEGCLLLLQRSSGDFSYPGQWDLPGGHTEAGETPEESLRREVWEETGLAIAAGDAFAEVEVPHPPKKPTARLVITGHLAVSTDGRTEPTLANLVESDHLQQAKWVAFEDIGRLKLIEPIRTLLDMFLAQFVDKQQQASA